MAKTVKSFRVDTKNKKVVLFTNIKQTKADELLIKTYLESGYTLKAEKKTSVEDMKKELEKADTKAFEEFERLYNLNEENGALGFHRACQYYTRFKKIAIAEKALKADTKALEEFKSLNDLTEEGLAKAIKFYNKWKKDNKSK